MKNIRVVGKRIVSLLKRSTISAIVSVVVAKCKNLMDTGIATINTMIRKPGIKVIPTIAKGEKTMEQKDLYLFGDNQKIIDYIFSGDVIITVRNEDTKNRFTFKIQKRKNPRKINIDLYWVSVLVRPDNEDSKSYRFIGALSREEGFRHSAKSYIKDKALSVNVAYYYFNRLLGFAKFPLHKNVYTYHSGYCGRCGKLLTVPESIASGFGKECSKVLNLPYEVRKGQYQQTLFDQPNTGSADYQMRTGMHFPLYHTKGFVDNG